MKDSTQKDYINLTNSVPIHLLRTEKDFEDANKLFLEAIAEGDNYESLYVIHRICILIWAEKMKHIKRKRDYSQIFGRRFGRIVKIIEKRESRQKGLILEFCWESLTILDSDTRPFYLDWLRTLEKREILEENLLIASEISVDAFGDTWETCRDELLSFLDREDREIRAIAAFKIGEFNCYYGADKPDISTLFELILQKEIERPGVANPFWWGYKNSIDLEDKRYDYISWFESILNKVKVETQIPRFGDGLSADYLEYKELVAVK